MNILLVLAVLLLIISAILMIIKLFQGPQTINRVIASDTLTAIVICTLGVVVMVTKYEVLLITMVTISLVSFVGSLALGRIFLFRNSQESEKK